MDQAGLEERNGKPFNHLMFKTLARLRSEIVVAFSCQDLSRHFSTL